MGSACCCCKHNGSEPPSPTIKTVLLTQTETKTIAKKIPILKLNMSAPKTIDEYAPDNEEQVRELVGSGRNFNFQFGFSPTESHISTQPSRNHSIPTSEIAAQWQSHGLQKKMESDNHIQCIKNPNNVCLSVDRLRFVLTWYDQYNYDCDGEESDLSTNSNSNHVNIIDFICNGINYSFIELINDFLHLKQFHFNYVFDADILHNIYQQFSNTNIVCTRHNEQGNNTWAFCMAQSRNNRNKSQCNENVYNKLQVYNLEDINYTKNKQDTRLILMIYLDCIHCYVFHSYLINMDTNDIKKYDISHSKFITEIRPYDCKQNVIGSDLWPIDGTQYFYSVYNNLKDELLHNELYRLEIHEFNDTYKQCKLFTKCKYYKTILSLRDSPCKYVLSTGDKPVFGSYCIAKGQYLSIDSLIVLCIMSNYDNVRYHFSKSFRANYANERPFFITKRHREYYNLSKILLSTIQSFGCLMGGNMHLYHALTTNIFGNTNKQENIINFKFPVSCTPFKSICTAYSYSSDGDSNNANVNDGIIMKLSGYNENISTYMMDISFVSERPFEFEYLFYGFNVQMNVRTCFPLKLNLRHDNDNNNMDCIGITDDIFANIMDKFICLFSIEIEIDDIYNKNKEYIDPHNICDTAFLQLLCNKMNMNRNIKNKSKLIFTQYMLEQFDSISTDYNSQILFDNNQKKQYSKELIDFIDDIMWNEYLWISLFPKVSIFIFNNIDCVLLEFINKFLNKLQNDIITEESAINQVQIKGVETNDIEKLIQLNYAENFQLYGWSLFLPEINNDICYSIAWRKIIQSEKRSTRSSRSTHATLTRYNSIRILSVQDNDDNKSPVD